MGQFRRVGAEHGSPCRYGGAQSACAVAHVRDGGLLQRSRELDWRTRAVERNRRPLRVHQLSGERRHDQGTAGGSGGRLRHDLPRLRTGHAHADHRHARLVLGEEEPQGRQRLVGHAVREQSERTAHLQLRGTRARPRRHAGRLAFRGRALHVGVNGIEPAELRPSLRNVRDCQAPLSRIGRRQREFLHPSWRYVQVRRERGERHRVPRAARQRDHAHLVPRRRACAQRH